MNFLTVPRSSSVVKPRGVDVGPVPLLLPRNGWIPLPLFVQKIHVGEQKRLLKDVTGISVN